jgi:hypothetical protein
MRERFPLDPSRSIDKVSSCPFVGIVTALDGSGRPRGKKGLGNSACVTALPATLRMDGAPVDLLHRSRKFLEAGQAVIYRNAQKYKVFRAECSDLAPCSRWTGREGSSGNSKGRRTLRLESGPPNFVYAAARTEDGSWHNAG